MNGDLCQCTKYSILLKYLKNAVLAEILYGVWLHPLIVKFAKTKT